MALPLPHASMPNGSFIDRHAACSHRFTNSNEQSMFDVNSKKKSLLLVPTDTPNAFDVLINYYDWMNTV